MTNRSEEFFIPPEWHPHRSTWLSWPHNLETWPQDILPQIWNTFGQIVGALSWGESVHINVDNEAMEQAVREHLKNFQTNPNNIFFHHFPTNDAWIRDHGPIFVIPSPLGGEGQGEGAPQTIALNFDYNAWGGKYPPFNLDNAIPTQVANFLKMECVTPGMVLEGGSIDANGCGTLLTTEQCLLNPNRNPKLSKAQIETKLKTYLGAKKILWLGEGIVGDDTDGHVDDITRFVAPDTIVTAVELDPQDQNYQALQDNLRRLETMTDQDDKAFKIIQIPMPAPQLHNGERLPASYANFYIANKVVLVPIFHDERDSEALEILGKLFPKRKVVGIDCRAFISGLGGIHCVTQQQPMFRVQASACKNS